MLSGPVLVIVFILSIIALIALIAKWKIHPFLALLSVSCVFALVSGIPLQNIEENGQVLRPGLVTTISSGFASTFQGIGLVIIFGALIGSILEHSGAAITISECVVKWIGPKHPELAMLIMGWIVSVPVFCDSGYVILNPIRRALARRTQHKAAALAVCLSAGLYAAHVFIPPTPGPIAAADTLGVGQNLLLLMGLGTIVSIPALLAAYIFAKKLANMTTAEDLEHIDADALTDELLSKKRPGAFWSFAPIVLPVLLMAFGSIFSALKLTGFFKDLFSFLGTPVVALALGLIIALPLLRHFKDTDLRSVTEKTLQTCGPILFITAAGSILGRVISTSGLVDYIKDNATVLAGLGIVFPFLLSAILKTAQGSSTVALVTTAGIMAPLMVTLGLDSNILRVLTVLAIGAGAMTVSHANDSYFWVVTNFTKLKTEEGYKTQTLVTLLEGLSSIVLIFVLWLLFR